MSRKHLDSQVNSSSVLKGLFGCCSHLNQLTAQLQAPDPQFEKQMLGKTNSSTSSVNVCPSGVSTGRPAARGGDKIKTDAVRKVYNKPGLMETDGSIFIF